MNESFSVMNWKGLAGTRMSLLINFGLKMNTKKQIIYCVILQLSRLIFVTSVSTYKAIFSRNKTVVNISINNLKMYATLNIIH